ncbi:MAG TPA: tetratricopeptide repeat protein [Bryobacteraceae bacterium]|nr:tetratricopeptide repeat protein [Bryobacteraceae bacterium]
MSLSISLAQEPPPASGGGGQTPSGGGGAPGGGAPGGGGTAPGSGPSIPGQGGTQPGRQPSPDQGRFPQDPRTQRSPFPDFQRPIYLSGKVMLDDGTAPPPGIVIERVCNGIAKAEGYTDSKGRFSFQLGQNMGVLQDASVSSADGFGGLTSPIGGRTQGISERELAGCEIRASLPGFRSDSVNLVGRRALDNPDVGTIVLHRLAKVEGFTFSATSALAPKDARKAYEKGVEQLKKDKAGAAEQELTKATTLYPKYAAAWYQLGVAYHQQNKLADAKRAYEESLRADSKFVSPYERLAVLAASEKKWDDVAQNTAQMIKLNPYYSPQVYFYSAVAHYNLQKMEIAEEHAREAAKMDEKHRIPRINQLLGIILAQKRDYKGAAENMRIYLKANPDAADAAMVRNQLAEVEKELGGGGTAQR